MPVSYLVIGIVPDLFVRAGEDESGDDSSQRKSSGSYEQTATVP